MQTPPFGDDFRVALRDVLASSQRVRSVEIDGSYALGTATGLVRRDNQDAAAIVRVRYATDPNRGFDAAIVCDGMGGTSRGREASVLAGVQFIWTLLLGQENDPEQRAYQAIQAANDFVYKRLGRDGGTTLSAVIIGLDGQAVCAHAGDSRIYSIGDGGAIEQVTQDDNLHAALGKGPDERSDLQSKLIQYVGMGEDLDPHVRCLSSRATSYFLTTDGVHSVAPSTFSRFVRASANGSEMVRRGLQLADILGGVDNASAVYLPAKPDWVPRFFSGGAIISILTAASSVEIQLPISNSDSHAEQSPNHASPSKTSASKKLLSKKPRSRSPRRAGNGDEFQLTQVETNSVPNDTTSTPTKDQIEVAPTTPSASPSVTDANNNLPAKSTPDKPEGLDGLQEELQRRLGLAGRTEVTFQAAGSDNSSPNAEGDGKGNSG